MRELWQKLQAVLPASSRPKVVALTIESAAAGVLEALVLVLAVNVALGSETASSSVDLLGWSVEPAAGLAAAAVAGVLVVGLHIHAARLAARLSADVLHGCRSRAMAAFEHTSWDRQAEVREGLLQDTIGPISVQVSEVVLNLTNYLTALVGLAAFLLCALVVDPVVTIVVVGAGALLFVVLRPIATRTRLRAQSFVTANSEMATRMSEWSTLAQDLKVFGVDAIEGLGLDQANRQAGERMYAARFWSKTGAGLYRDLAALLLVGAVTVIYLSSDLDFASIATVLLLVVRSLTYAQQVQVGRQIGHELAPNLDLFEERVRQLEGSVERFGAADPDAVTPLELNAVDYHYDDHEIGLHDVSFRIDPGEFVGVVGPSGAGKSTLAQVVLRLRKPTSGGVVAAGLPAETISADTWAHQVAFVPQEPRLLSGTVADNIAFFRAIEREELVTAARLAHVYDDIMALPDGFDTVLGPRGSGVSGGQKQRIAIARALAGQPSLIVLDEPTSALDSDSERRLQETIAQLHGVVSLLVIAHRTSTLTNCDKVVALDRGRVVSVGSLEAALTAIARRDGHPVLIDEAPRRAAPTDDVSP